MVNIYCDLDGVIFDFDKAYFSMYDTFDKEKFNESIADRRIFENLELMPHANELLDILRTYNEVGNTNIFALSSLGNSFNLIDAAEQKTNCMEKHGIDFMRPLYTVHKGLKKRFAAPNSILIDDTHQNIYDFNECHGTGILYEGNKTHMIIRREINRLMNLYTGDWSIVHP